MFKRNYKNEKDVFLFFSFYRALDPYHASSTWKSDIQEKYKVCHTAHPRQETKGFVVEEDLSAVWMTVTT